MLNPSILRRCPFLLTAALLVPLTVACSTTLQSASIVPAKVELMRQHPQAVTLEATGQEEPWIGFALIPTDTWYAALEQAVLDSELFAEVKRDGDAPFVLTAKLRKLEEPEYGINMRAYLTVDWSLRRSESSEVLWEQSISSTGVAGPRDEEDMHDRARIAIERSARQNIEQGLARMSRLEL